MCMRGGVCPPRTVCLAPGSTPPSGSLEPGAAKMCFLFPSLEPRRSLGANQPFPHTLPLSWAPLAPPLPRAQLRGYSTSPSPRWPGDSLPCTTALGARGNTCPSQPLSSSRRGWAGGPEVCSSHEGRTRLLLGVGIPPQHPKQRLLRTVSGLQDMLQC